MIETTVRTRCLMDTLMECRSFIWAVGLLMTAACGAPNVVDEKATEQLRARVRAQQAEIKRLKLQLDIEKATVAGFQQARETPEAVPDPPVDVATASTEPVERHTVAMCYKDYCPCDPPQGGPDSVLCDQLEEGVDVDVQMMIAGRGMREARRQLATGDY